MNSIQGIGGIGRWSSVGQGQVGAGANGGSFAETLRGMLDQVSEAQESSSATVQAFLQGEPVELHQVMAASEEAGIALDMLIEIRNKLTEAYRTVINMQS